MAHKTVIAIRSPDIDAIIALKDVDLAYIAGFFDGEGTIGLYKTNNDRYFGISVALVQTDPRVLIWIHEIFGGSLVHCVNKERYDFYRLEFRGIDSARLLLKRILPYMREKREQAELMISYDLDMSYDERSAVMDQLKGYKARNRDGRGTLDASVASGESDG